jgi:biotin carboxylase
MQTLLVLAAGPLQIPVIREAQAMGLRTVAADHDPAAPGLALVDRGYVVDILDAGMITDIARSERVDGIIAPCTDAPVRTLARACQTLGLPGPPPEAALATTDKRLMRRALRSFPEMTVDSYEIRDLSSALRAAEDIGYPVAVKAPCSSGSRGIRKADDAAALASGFQEACRYQPDGRLLVERWVQGVELSVEGVCTGEHPHIVQLTDKLVFDGPFPVESGHTQPSSLPVDEQHAVRRTVATAIAALGLRNCAFHAEVKSGADGLRVIEVGARLGGDRITTDLTPLSTGVNIVRAAIHVAIGGTPQLTPTISRGAAIRYFHAGWCGRVRRVDGMSEIANAPGHVKSVLASDRDGEVGPGFLIPEIRSSLDRYGFVIFAGANAAEAAARADEAAASVHFSPVEPGHMGAYTAAVNM